MLGRRLDLPPELVAIVGHPVVYPGPIGVISSLIVAVVLEVVHPAGRRIPRRLVEVMEGRPQMARRVGVDRPFTIDEYFPSHGSEYGPPAPYGFGHEGRPGRPPSG